MVLCGFGSGGGRQTDMQGMGKVQANQIGMT